MMVHCDLVLWRLPVAVFILQQCITLLFDFSYCVVVDGHKKKDIQATKRQSDEKSMIDKFNDKNCGIFDTNYNEHEFISMAKEGQFPWMVSFQITTLNNSTKDDREKIAANTTDEISKMKWPRKRLSDLHFCCGSFISPKWILSAAHCFKSKSKSIEKYLQRGKLKAVAGSHKVSSRNPINVNLTIERIYTHSQFDPNNPIGFDVALVELKNKVEFTQKRINGGPMDEQIKPFINSICLPLKDKRYKSNETVRITGWGMSSDKDETSMPSKLLTTDILIDDKINCTKRYSELMKSDRPKEQLQKYDDFLCASYKDFRDACQSDSGAPLMEYADGKAVAIGIVSYGIGCATRGVPGLYTRTSAYIKWIEDITTYGKEASVAFKLMEANGSTKPTTTAKPGDNKTTVIAVSHQTPTQKITTSTTTTRSPSSKAGPSFKFYDQ